ncbi:hypothetical protein [Humibacter sp.]|uniref:hypothetical protein n=1 Tax=Humibacter sp. TaxID=1940291 RepID=UPI003F7FEC4A
MDEIADITMGCFAVLFVLGVALLLTWLVADSVQSYRAFDAIAACQTQRMEPVRRNLSTKVVCVPINTRQDTTTVNVNTRADR